MDLGRFFGRVSGAAVTMTCNKVAREMAQSKKLRSKIKRIKEQILNI